MPDQKILQKYADVLVNFALWSGEGVQEGDVVFVSIPECAKPFLLPLQETILKAGAHPIIEYKPDGIARSFLELADEEQVLYVPKNILLGRVEDCTHIISILAESDKHELEGIDSRKIMAATQARKFYMDARRDKEDRGKLTWTLGLFGTQAMADEVNMSLEEYWAEIINACYLEEEDPVQKWKEIMSQIETYKSKLDELQIEWLHIEGEDVDLKVKVGKDRKWLGGSGRNIPSFELFVSPDWRGTEGRIRFNQPLYRYGNLIEGIALEFKDGVVTSSSATKNEEVLKNMIATENADKIGEFSLTDKRFSRITRFMGETLYDENVGGEFGNTHIALGMAYKDSYRGDVTSVSETEWEEFGFNDSVVHTDIMSTTNRTVTATLVDGTERVIYKDGMFQLD